MTILKTGGGRVTKRKGKVVSMAPFLAGVAIVSLPSAAFADCNESAPGTGIFLCSGPTTTTPLMLTGTAVTVTATSDFDLDDTNGLALQLESTTGDIIFSDAATSSVSSPGIGMIVSSAGAVDLTINGEIDAVSAGITIAGAAGPVSIDVTGTGRVVGSTAISATGAMAGATITINGTIEGGISSGSGDDEIFLEQGSSVIGSSQTSFDLGSGSDTITVRGDAALPTGIQLRGGGSPIDLDRLVFDGGTRTLLTAGDFGSPIVYGWDELLATGNIDLTLDSRLATFQSGSGNPPFTTGFVQLTDGGITIDAGSTLHILPETFSVLGSVTNAGHIDLADGVTKKLIIGAGGQLGQFLGGAGNYTSNGGSLSLDVALGDSSSAADVLVVYGDTAGTTTVNIHNIGGNGAQTTGDGINVIQVLGNSDGEFVLGAPVIAGAYKYNLYEGPGNALADGKGATSTNSWYLISSLAPVTPPTTPSTPTTPSSPGTPDTPDTPVQPDPPVVPIDPVSPAYQPGVPLYEAYPQALQALNRAGTLRQRMGNRYWEDRPIHNPQTVFCKDPAQNFRCAVTDEQAGYYASEGDTVFIEQNGIWGRIETSHGRFRPDVSTSSTNYDTDRWDFQAGVDGQLLERDGGKLIAGLGAHYGTVRTDVRSIHGDGDIDVQGFGADATLTWYGNSGFYADATGRVTVFSSDLNSDTLGMRMADGNDGLGYELSLEAGQRFNLNTNWSLTPQVQLSYSSVDFDDFTDPFGARVSLDDGDSLQGRIGLAIDRSTNWKDGDGRVSRLNLYSVANVYNEFLDGSRVDVSGTKFTSRNDRVWGSLEIGGTYNWANDAYSIHGGITTNTSLENFGDSYSVGGNLGFKVKW